MRLYLIPSVDGAKIFPEEDLSDVVKAAQIVLWATGAGLWAQGPRATL